MKARQRHALLRGVIAAARVDQYLAQLFAQPYVTRRAIDCALQRLDGAIDHAILDQQLRV